MNELRVKQSKHNLHFMPWVWFMFCFFAFFHFLGNGYSKTALILLVLVFLLIAMLHRVVLQQSKREVIINKQENKITALEKSLLKKEIVHYFPISSFRGVRSYLPYSGGSRPENHVVLLYKDSDKSLLLSTFGVSSGNKFFSHGWYEIKEAEALRIAVSNLTGLTDFGFQNKHWHAFS